ncbi:MAG: patatin family protein, partial [Burkholderiaceae bacterium]
RLELGMKGYQRSHPGTTIILFEPEQRDPEMFLANTFSYSQRRALAEHAYQHTRHQLRSRRSALRQQLEPHGVGIDDAVLDDPGRRLLSAQAASPRRGTAQALRRLEEVLDDLDLVLDPAAPIV